MKLLPVRIKTWAARLEKSAARTFNGAAGSEKCSARIRLWHVKMNLLAARPENGLPAPPSRLPAMKNALPGVKVAR
jgi:hypothetical protein